MCLGSSLFLKNRFGVGYKITFVKKKSKVHPDLYLFLNEHFGRVEKHSEVAGEISFIISRD